jgi:6-phosphogluconolactonase
MRDVSIYADAEALAEAVATRLLQRVSTAQAEGRVPHLALTGGEVAHLVHQAIAARASEHVVDWTRVVFWFGDERFVPAGSSDRNALQARQDFLDVVGATQVHEIPSTDDAPSASEAASTYAATMRAEGAAEFDLVMLGMGPDGHVASLFPGLPQLESEDVTVPVTGPPKPPPERVSLTFGALNRARSVWFLVTGDAKADAVQKALADDGDLHDTPARGIRVPDTTWFLDTAAAGRL